MKVWLGLSELPANEKQIRWHHGISVLKIRGTDFLFSDRLKEYEEKNINRR
jgi:hypothetical protein